MNNCIDLPLWCVKVKCSCNLYCFHLSLSVYKSYLGVVGIQTLLEKAVQTHGSASGIKPMTLHIGGCNSFNEPRTQTKFAVMFSSKYNLYHAKDEFTDFTTACRVFNEFSGCVEIICFNANICKGTFRYFC